MEAEPKRKRRFQFSLLMIGVALFGVFAGWVGNQVRVVREREVMAFRPGVDSVTTEARGKLPWIRIWLGDKCYTGLLLDRASAEEVDIYKNTFPEATVLQRESSDFHELYHRLHSADRVQPTR